MARAQRPERLYLDDGSEDESQTAEQLLHTFLQSPQTVHTDRQEIDQPATPAAQEFSDATGNSTRNQTSKSFALSTDNEFETSDESESAPQVQETPTRLRPRLPRTGVPNGQKAEKPRTPKRSRAASSTPKPSDLRISIDNGIRKKRDNFLFAHKDPFLAVLPDENYVSAIANAGPTAVYQTLQNQPTGVTGVMKSHQISGLSYLLHLHDNGMPGIIADPMGFGKTLQTLALLQYLKENTSPGMTYRPSLVIVPQIVIDVWIKEAQKWTPRLRVFKFHDRSSNKVNLRSLARGCRVKKIAGSSLTEEEKVSQAEPFDIIVTSYETYISEAVWLRRSFLWHYVILDEGHRIKNHETKLFKALETLKSDFRLVITGTPLQNNLCELWALLHWLLPEVFVKNTLDIFDNAFNLTRAKFDASISKNAGLVLNKFTLRRDEKQANLQLPPKTTVTLFAPLTSTQRSLYKSILTNEYLTKGVLQEGTGENIELLNATNSEAVSANNAPVISVGQRKDVLRRKRLMNVLMYLRQVCTHPWIVSKSDSEPETLDDSLIQVSGKFILLEMLVRELIIGQKKKIIIFSGFLDVLDYCEDLISVVAGLDSPMFKVVRIDGATTIARRNLAIRLFQNDPQYKICLISTRTGGVGITLTAASQVVMIDEDWNPAVDAQAQSRAHRIGQVHPVTVYKISTRGTVEQQMISRIRKKLFLSVTVLESMRGLDNESPSFARRSFSASIDANDSPPLDSDELLSVIRQGAEVFAYEEADPKEMRSWDFDAMLKHCQDVPTPVEAQTEPSAAVDKAEFEDWMRTAEIIRTTVLEGNQYKKEIEPPWTEYDVPSTPRSDRKIGKERTVKIGEFDVLKETIGLEEGQAVATVSTPSTPSFPKTAKLSHFTNQKICLTCSSDHGELIACASCPRAYHFSCLPLESQAAASRNRKFACPQHRCTYCKKDSLVAGGLVYRCRKCPNAFCEDCLDSSDFPWCGERVVGDSLEEFDQLSYSAVTAFFIVCMECQPTPHGSAAKRKSKANDTKLTPTRKKLSRGID